MILRKRDNETNFEHHKRIIEGKLCNKDYSDYDYSELSEYAYGKKLSTDVARREFYGSLYTIQLMQNEESKSVNNVLLQNKVDTSLNQDGTQSRSALIKLSEEESKNPECVLKAHGYDSKYFELVSAKNSIWSVAGKDKNYYSSKISVKPLKQISQDNSLNAIEEIFKKYNPKLNNITLEEVSEKNECLVLNYFDVHFGKLCTSEYAGINYGWKQCQKDLYNITEEYLRRFKNRKIEKIIFAIGNDYFNCELTGNTNAGTPQDNDGSIYNLYKMGIETLIGIIDRLSTLAKVEVVLVTGNHDYDSSITAAMAIKAWYRNSDNVSVDDSPQGRKYITYGNDLFGFTHGAEEKNRIYEIMQVEVPELWGKSLYRTWFTGHYHHESTKEKSGLIVRQSPSISPTDRWHYKNGYVGSLKRTVGYIYNKKIGLVETHYVGI